MKKASVGVVVVVVLKYETYFFGSHLLKVLVFVLQVLKKSK